MEWTATLLVAAVAAALGALGASAWARLARGRRRSGLEPVRARIDEHLLAIAETLARVEARVSQTTTRRGSDLGAILDLQALLDHVVAEAAAVTGAPAVAVRVSGPEGTPVVASVGPSDGAALLDATLGPPDARPFRALTITWTYGTAGNGPDDAYRSALVVPLADEDEQTIGALAAYAGSTDAFEPRHLRALRELADECAPAIANARRFAELGRRTLTDDATGVRNRSGYELELEREVARAHRTGQPLSLFIVQLGTPDEAEAVDEASDADSTVREVAELLARTARTTDIPCRRRKRELAVVLPETHDDGARRFWSRFSEQAVAAGLGGAPPKTLAVGLVEWRPNETSAALDARALAAVGRTAMEGPPAAAGADAKTIELPRARRDPAGRRGGGPVDDARRRFLGHLASAIATARQRSAPLAVVAVELDGPGGADEAAVQAAHAHVAARIDDSVDAGAVVSRLADDRFAIAVPGATAVDAESVVAVLQAALGVRPPASDASASISAGVAELAPDDDEAALLARSERALLRARSAGGGAVVRA